MKRITYVGFSEILNMARNKKVVCVKCFRVMRRDNLERHMKQHENGKFEIESLCGSSLSASTTSLESNFSSVSTTRSVSINEEAVLKTMNMHAEEYERKLQLVGCFLFIHVARFECCRRKTIFSDEKDQNSNEKYARE